MLLSALGLLLLSANAVAADFDLGLGESAKPASEGAVVQVLFSGQLDFRFAYTGDSQNWWNGGGGLVQYGALKNAVPSGGLRRDASFHLTRIGLDTDVLVRNAVAAHLQFNYDDHPALTGNQLPVGLVQAYASPAFSGPFGARVGLVFPPLSMEQGEVAWTNTYTITPSAISTWVGEELRAVAAEVSWKVKPSASSTFTVLVAPFSGNDTAGAILSWRGWALHDYQLKVGDRLPVLPDIPAAFSNGATAPGVEVDGHPGVYGKLIFDHADGLRIEAFGYSSFGDTAWLARDSFGMNYAWKTMFGSLGVKYEAGHGLTFLGQALAGKTEMGNPIVVKNDLYAWFALASWKHGHHRLTIRYDRFGMIDRDASADSNTQQGSAETVAYFHEFDRHHALGAEYLHPTSERVGNTGISASDPFDDLVQLTYRFTF